MGQKGGTSVAAATHDKKGLENKPAGKYGTLQQDQTLDNKDKGNAPNDAIKKVSSEDLAQVSAAASEAAGEATVKVLEDRGIIPKVEEPEVKPDPQPVGQPVASSSEPSVPEVKPSPEIKPEVQPEVQPEITQEVRTVKGSRPTFDPKTGQWVLAHANFKTPMRFASKEDAQKVALTLRANDIPEVAYDPETKTYDVDHPDWEETVSVATPEEAKGVIASKLVALGAEEDEAKADAETMVTEATPKEEEKTGEASAETPATTPTPDGTQVASSGTKVTADVKQNMKGTPDKELVSGMPPPAAEKKSGDKGLFPDIPGRVVEVTPGPQAPKGGSTNGSMKTQHGGDYGSLAKQSQAEINKLKSAHGLRKEVVKLFSSEEGMAMARNLLALCSVVPLSAIANIIESIEVKADGVEPEAAREYISKVISEETAEGKSAKPQAIAMAYTKARAKTSDESLGWKIPASPES